MFRFKLALMLLCLLLISLVNTFALSAQDDPARLLYEGGEDYVVSMAISPDDQQLALGTGNGNTIVLNIETGEEIQRFSAHDATVSDVLFTADGSLWNTTVPRFDGGDNMLRLFDLQSGEAARVITNSGVFPGATALSPDNAYLFYIIDLSDGQLRDIATSTITRRFIGHTGRVTDAAFSGDGLYLVTGSEDETNHIDNKARLWDVATGEELQRFEGHSDGITSVAISPDARFVLTGSWDATARLWDAATGAELRQLTGHNETVSSVAFSPDGAFVITGSWDGSVRVWDAAIGAELQRFETDWVTSLAVSHDGTFIVASAGDGTVHLWQLDN